MPFVPVPNVLGVEVVYELDGQRLENTLYFLSGESDWDLITVPQFLDNLNDYIVSTILPLLSNTIRLVELVGTLLDTATSLSFTYTAPAGQFGGINEEANPNNVAYTMTFRTAGRGRSARGRNYIAGLSVGTVGGNTVDPTWRGAITTAYNGLMTFADTNNCVWVVVSRYVNGAPRVTGLVQPVTGAGTFDAVVDSQRRRLPGRGT